MAKYPECGEYVSSIDTPKLITAPQLKGGHVVKKNGKIIRYAGGFCIVFPFEASKKKYAVRCWHAGLDNPQKRTKAISEELIRVQLPYFVGFEYVDKGIMTSQGTYPIVIMDWVNAQPLKEYIASHLTDSSCLKQLAANFLTMVKDLHSHQLAHGDLQHGNILVKGNGQLVLVDYDSMYVPALDGYIDEIKGLEGYQHPARWANTNLTAKADYFSELVIYTSILALAYMPNLWTKLNIENTETLLFTGDDIQSKGSAKIFQTLEKTEELKRLSAEIKKALLCTSIDNLKPLEDVIVSPCDSISAKWADNGYQKPIPPTPHEQAQSIASKW